MTNKLIIRLFLCLALIQLLVPLSMIAKREIVLGNGARFKFKVAPVDPYDAFRGRYVALSIDKNYVPATAGIKVEHGQTVFALIGIDGQGFAELSGIAINRPVGKPYITTKVASYFYQKDKIYLDLPINRYYMEEKSAPLAERIYQRHSQRNKRDAFVVVRVKGGIVVIENLYVGGQKIEDMVKQEMKKSGSSALRKMR